MTSVWNILQSATWNMQCWVRQRMWYRVLGYSPVSKAYPVPSEAENVKTVSFWECDVREIFSCQQPGICSAEISVFKIFSCQQRISSAEWGRECEDSQSLRTWRPWDILLSATWNMQCWVRHRMWRISSAEWDRECNIRVRIFSCQQGRNFKNDVTIEPTTFERVWVRDNSSDDRRGLSVWEEVQCWVRQRMWYPC
jgi:hypothetical protein